MEVLLGKGIWGKWWYVMINHRNPSDSWVHPIFWTTLYHACAFRCAGTARADHIRNDWHALLEAMRLEKKSYLMRIGPQDSFHVFQVLLQQVLLCKGVHRCTGRVGSAGPLHQWLPQSCSGRLRADRDGRDGRRFMAVVFWWPHEASTKRHQDRTKVYNVRFEKRPGEGRAMVVAVRPISAGEAGRQSTENPW